MPIILFERICNIQPPPPPQKNSLKLSEENKVWEDVKRLESSCTFGGTPGSDGASMESSMIVLPNSLNRITLLQQRSKPSLHLFLSVNLCC